MTGVLGEVVGGCSDGGGMGDAGEGDGLIICGIRPMLRVFADYIGLYETSYPAQEVKCYSDLVKLVHAY